MSVFPTGCAAPVAGARDAGAPERRRRLVRWATLLTCCTVVASAGWGLVMWTVAPALRPEPLKSATYTPQVPAAAAAALVQMRIILLATFAVLVMLAALAIVVGRRELRLRVQWRLHHAATVEAIEHHMWRVLQALLSEPAKERQMTKSDGRVASAEEEHGMDQHMEQQALGGEGRPSTTERDADAGVAGSRASRTPTHPVVPRGRHRTVVATSGPAA